MGNLGQRILALVVLVEGIGVGSALALESDLIYTKEGVSKMVYENAMPKSSEEKFLLSMDFYLVERKNNFFSGKNLVFPNYQIAGCPEHNPNC